MNLSSRLTNAPKESATKKRAYFFTRVPEMGESPAEHVQYTSIVTLLHKILGLLITLIAYNRDKHQQSCEDESS